MSYAQHASCRRIAHANAAEPRAARSPTILENGMTAASRSGPSRAERSAPEENARRALARIVMWHVDMLSRAMPHLGLLVMVAACAAESATTGEGASNQTATPIGNQSGHPVDLSGVHDPIADLFQGGSATDAPTTFKDLVAAFVKADTANACNIKIALVSERAQLLNRPEPFRLVFIRSCGTKRILFSPMQTVAPGGPLPTEAEIMAFDETKQVFDFYALEAGHLRFMGTSIDMLEGPGAGTGRDQERRCANCHTGGGPIMKELILPWANWDGPTGTHFNGGTTSPGSNDVFTQVTKAMNLSAFHTTGDFLQSVVQDGNTAWNKARLTHLASKDSASLLRPLFCTTEVNLQMAPTLRGPMTLFDPDFFVNSGFFNVFTSPSVSVDGSVYNSVVQAHQKMVDQSGAVLTGSNGKKLVDTAFAFNHPFASFADNDYLKDVAAVTSNAFVSAVVAVDFTTPVFSDRRCGLLKHVPAIPVDVAHPDAYAKALTDGLVQALQGAAQGSPEAELLQNLQDAAGPQPRVTAFLNACATRANKDPNGLMLDALKIESRQRRRFRALPIFEHRELMPEDDLNVPDGARLDPVDCTLK
jgi:hypothetical protein